MVIQGGKLAYTLNTSTGGGYTYTDKSGTSVAITPKGVFHIIGVINGLDVDSLGALWRPRFFTEGASRSTVTAMCRPIRFLMVVYA